MSQLCVDHLLFMCCILLLRKEKIFFVCDFACSFFVFTGISSQISAMLGSFLLPVKFRLSLFVWKCYLFCGFMIKKLTECG